MTRGILTPARMEKWWADRRRILRKPSAIPKKPSGIERPCVNCRHYDFYAHTALCISPHQPVSLVFGNPRPASCENERSLQGKCGPDGSHYEPKPPRPRRWWEFK